MKCWARWLAFKEMRGIGMTNSMISAYAGYDHTTVSYAHKALRECLGQPENHLLREMCDNVGNTIKSG